MKKVGQHQRHADVPLGHPDRNAGAPGTQQSHDYTPSTSYNPPQNEHEQGVYEGKGEAAKRVRKADPSVTLGHHVTAVQDGNAVRKERRQHVLANRKAQEATFVAHRRHLPLKIRKTAANADRLPK